MHLQSATGPRNIAYNDNFKQEMKGHMINNEGRRGHSSSTSALINRCWLQQNQPNNINSTDFSSSLKPSAYSYDNSYLQHATLSNSLQQRYYMLSPQLYESYRNQSCTEEIKGQTFNILRFSGGRNEIYLANLCEIELPGVVKLTVWKNDDYKLIVGGEQVYFWHQKQKILDKYCQSI